MKRQVFVRRYIIVIAMLIVVLVSMVGRLYYLQITQHSYYSSRAESKSTKTILQVGRRGTIYDSNMIPLAYDQISYNVQFYRNPSQTSEQYRSDYTQSILAAITLIESNGKTTLDPSTEFWLKRDENGAWVWNFGEGASDYVKKTREEQWRGNFYLTGETKYPVENLFDELCRKYLIPEDLPEEMKLKILAVWQASRMNNYNSTPVTIAYDVGFETVAEIEAMANQWLGISIAESSTRVYPYGPLASHVIGYISRITSASALASYREKGYTADALVGATGIEYSMEDQLSPYIQYRQGKQVVEINTRGAVVREIDYVAPMDGNSVLLTIDTNLQAVMERELALNIEKIHSFQEDMLYARTSEGVKWNTNNAELLAKYAENDWEVSLAKTGAMVAMDPYSGKVLGIANCPGFNLSIFGTSVIDPGGWSEIVSDDRNPMFNRAVSAKDTPGSIFKLCTSLGGLSEGALTLTETISDGGQFYREGTDTSYKPTCWINPSKRYQHADQTVVEGIKNSCNYFFYEVGYRLGINDLVKWAAALGLTTKTNIELPSESTSFVGNQQTLYDPTISIPDQYTYKPILAANQIEAMIYEIAEDRGVEYDSDYVSKVVKSLLDIVVQHDLKSDWYPVIRSILIYDLGIPLSYITQHYLVNEVTSYLNDLKWTPSETIMCAIGQSITQVTPIAVARYASAIVNSGTVYDAQIIDKIIAPDGTVVMEKSPVVANQIVTDEAYFNAIRTGMEEVTEIENDGSAALQFAKARYPIAAKTGTSQRTELDLENNSWLICYAPKKDPKIVVVVYIQNGYAGARAADAAIHTIEYYLDSLGYVETNTLVADNTLAD